VLARRLLLFASLLLLASALGSALRPREDTGRRDRSALNPAPLPADRVTAVLPSDDPVLASVGDIVELTVRSEQADRAEVFDLAVDAPTDARTPATLLVIADRAGRFPVTLRYSGEQVGTLDVRAP
jgi:hypothetical protein